VRLAAEEFEFVIFDDCNNDDRSLFLSKREDVAVLRRLCKFSLSSSAVSLRSRSNVESK